MRHYKRTITIRSLLMTLIFANLFLAMFLDNIAIYRYILEPVVTVLLLLEASQSGKRFSKAILTFGVTVLGVLYAILIGADIAKIYLHLFCYLNAILFFNFMIVKTNQEYVLSFCRSNIGYLKIYVILVSFIEAFMMISRRGYTNRYKWGGTFFQGTSSMPHTMSYLMLVVIAVVIIILMMGNKKIWGLGSIIPFFAIFQSGARISIILSAFLLFIIIDQILTSKQKNVFIKIMVVVAMVITALYVFRNRIFSSSLWAKIQIRSGGSYELTAGRTYVWADMIDKYLHNSTIIEYFIGRGDDKTYYYNSINPLVLNTIWAHSDYFQVLIGKGAVGIWLYASATFEFFKSIHKQNNNIYKWMIILMILLAGALNGFYSYRDTTMSIPLFALIGFYYGKEIEQDGSQLVS